MTTNADSETWDVDSPDAQEKEAMTALFTEDRLAELETLFKTWIVRFPKYVFGWQALGAILIQQGRSAEELAPIQKALVNLQPEDAIAHFSFGNTQLELGQFDDAVASYHQSLKIKPDFAEAYSNLGSVLQHLGQLDDGKTTVREPDLPDARAYFNLGNTQQELGQPDSAAASYRQALKLRPDYTEAYINLGNVFSNLGQLDNAIMSYHRALAFKPDSAEAYNNLGSVLQHLGQLNNAMLCFRRALEIKPDYAEAHNNLGYALHCLGQLDDAETCYRRTLEIWPDCAEARNNLGLNFQKQGRLDEAEASLRGVLKSNPDYANACNNLGSLLQKRGQLDEAVSYFRQALKIKPDYIMAHSNLIFTLDLMTNKDTASLQEERKRWDAAHAAHLHQQQTHVNIPAPERRIRIGYVSADFREHSAPKAFGSVLTCYDRTQFEVFAYSNFNGKDDRVTELFKQNVTAWRNICGLSDDAVAQRIREDRIDILVDLSGHMAGNRLLVFARKPAPIQITAWGYAAGTGMKAMDVFFTDPVMVPPEDHQYFVENIRYLPNAMGAFFMSSFPDVNELPALPDEIVTFGSFNRLAKVSDTAFCAWAEILLAVPRSRLMLKATELNDKSTQERVIAHFTKVGVTADRIIMQGKTSWNEHIKAYRQIDISLDPFPHGGGITALEGLLMGVPVINWRGPTIAGRVSASIMTTMGLSDWIAESLEEYVDLAIQKATDLESLAILRRQLRGIFTSSEIGDQAAYARAVEHEYRKLWREWCSLALR